MAKRMLPRKTVPKKEIAKKEILQEGQEIQAQEGFKRIQSPQSLPWNNKDDNSVLLREIKAFVGDKGSCSFR